MPFRSDTASTGRSRFWAKKVVAGCLFSLLLAATAFAAPEQSGTNDGLNTATAIKSAIERDKLLSGSAHAITVIATDDREVYLIGNVISEDERKRVDEIAQGFLEGYQLKDQLVVAH